MKTTVEKLRNVAQIIAKEKPPLHFFGLVRFPDLPSHWDLLVSSDKLTRDPDRYDYLVGLLKKKLTNKEMAQIMQIVTLRRNDPLIVALRRQAMGEESDDLTIVELPEQAIILWPPRKAASFAHASK